MSTAALPAARPRRSAARVGFSALGLAALAAAATILVGGPARLQGWALYHGQLPVQGRILGHAADLPPMASVCANCHEPASGAGEARRSIAALGAATLTEPRSRRGGPASAYTAESFCALLRTGIDPAYVMVDRTMPRFDLSDGDCNALWTYVSAR